MPRPSLLIESWLPVAEMGAESKRENTTGLHPPINRLHVWWARRPLTTSRAAILASALPAWSADFPPALRAKFPNETTYHAWFLHLIGVRGDPVLGQKLIRMAKAKGIQLASHPYGGAPRAFTINPDLEDLQTLGDLLEWTWGTRQPAMLDPFAGGGSIPFEALRFGFETYANDLNPVAAVILKATLDYPARFGPSLAEEIRKWGNIWSERVKERLTLYFPKGDGENIFAYLWARTITWQGRTVPLSPNWWLATGNRPIAARLHADPDSCEPRFEILTGEALRAAMKAGFDPDDGTIARGIARDPWTGETINREYIKAEAQGGRLGQTLYAVSLKQRGGFVFRAPTKEDVRLACLAETALAEHRAAWEVRDIIPTEVVEEGQKTDEPRRYGEYSWSELFCARQILAHAVALEELKRLEVELSEATDRDKALFTYLALAFDKATTYNNRHARFDPSRGIRSIFDRHDFAFVWSFAEFDASSNLTPWVVSQVADAFENMAKMTHPVQTLFTTPGLRRPVERLNINRGSASHLSQLADGSIDNITVDPPYYDNVMYAELADFFYVWLKRSVGHLFPGFFTDELTDKDDEAVANPARFAALGSKKKQLANDDYQRKMAAAFREMHRVLHDDGCLTVMFTHKRVEAWDTLASAMIGAGFTIEASWPVHTESEHSLHQAKKNAAASTILLVCRKRPAENDGQPVFWDDVQGEVRRVARQKATEYAEMGIGGADLYISTFGPALSVISRRWPVLTSEVDPKTGQPRPLRPEIALDLAREEVVRLRKEGLLAGRPVRFDAPTDWYLLAWDAYQAEQFPYDEARKLAVALGVDLDHDLMRIKRLASKKSNFITLAKPSERRKNGMVDEDENSFPHWIDAAHTAMMVYAESGGDACNAFLLRAGLKNDQTFKDLLQALINAIPRNKVKGKFVRPEAEVLENMRLAFYNDLTVPAEEELPDTPAYQQNTWEHFLAEQGEEYNTDEEEE